MKSNLIGIKLKLSISMLACIFAPALADVNPQPDQGSRQIIYNIGTVVDVIESQIVGISGDQNTTFTAIAAVQETVDTIDSKVDLVLNNLNVIADFDGTYTAIAAVQETVDTIDSKVDVVLNNLNVVADFNGTYTAIAEVQECCAKNCLRF